jgi:argininosuccinate lyase
MQEIKAIFDSVDTVESALVVFAPMLRTMKVNKGYAKRRRRGFINATTEPITDREGMPFRSAYKVMGEIVATASRTAKP